MIEPKFESKEISPRPPPPRKKKPFEITSFVKWHKLCGLWPHATAIFGWMIGYMNGWIDDF